MRLSWLVFLLVSLFTSARVSASGMMGFVNQFIDCLLATHLWSSARPLPLLPEDSEQCANASVSHQLWEKVLFKLLVSVRMNRNQSSLSDNGYICNCNGTELSDDDLNTNLTQMYVFSVNFLKDIKHFLSLVLL